MTYIIAEPCVSTCDTACVEVCPVDCIHGPDDKTGAGAEAKEPGFDPEGKQLYINPEECIDCGACEPECPVDAIIMMKEAEKPTTSRADLFLTKTKMMRNAEKLEESWAKGSILQESHSPNLGDKND